MQRAADKVRVNVQLIDARADSHLWAKSYDRDIKDVFAVESEVSQEIADALSITRGTVKWHVNIILRRLDVNDRTQAVVVAVQRGIVEI